MTARSRSVEVPMPGSHNFHQLTSTPWPYLFRCTFVIPGDVDDCSLPKRATGIQTNLWGQRGGNPLFRSPPLKLDGGLSISLRTCEWSARLGKCAEMHGKLNCLCRLSGSPTPPSMHGLMWRTFQESHGCRTVAAYSLTRWHLGLGPVIIGYGVRVSTTAINPPA